MNSLRIGKIIFKMWKNKWLITLSDSVILGILPILFILAVISSAGYAYVTVKDLIFSISGNLAIDDIFMFINHFSTLAFFATIGITFILWQLMIRTSVQNKYLETLPVSLKEWKIGQLVPIFILIQILLGAVFFPIILVLIKQLPVSIGQTSFILVVFWIMINCGMFIGFLWQQAIYLLSKQLVNSGSSAQLKTYHTLLSIISILLILFFAILLGLDTIEQLLTVSPTGLFNNFSMQLVEGKLIIFSLIGIFLYLGVLISLLNLSFGMEGEQNLEIFATYVPLRNIKFHFSHWISMFQLEMKRIARDTENLLYCFLAIVFLTIAGYYIRMYSHELNLNQLFEQLAIWGVAEFLAIFPLLSRGRDAGQELVFRSLPLSPVHYIFGKYLIYITVFPIFSLLLYLLIMTVGGYEVNLFNGSTYTYSYFFSVIIFSIAFGLGVALPSDEKKFMSLFVNAVIFLIISIPIYFVIMNLMQYPLIWLITGAIGIAALIFGGCVQIEKRRGYQ